MSFLKRKLNEEDRQLLGFEITRLFELQDRKLEDSKRELLITELGELNIPFRAIISGLRNLGISDVKSLKFSTLAQSIRNEYHEDIKNIKCDSCHGLGRITMVNKKMQHFAIACICPNGLPYAAQGLTVWNTKRTQVIGVEEMTRYEFLLFGEKKYQELYEGGNHAA